MNVFVMMTGKAYASTIAVAVAAGAALTGATIWLCNKWDEHYADARSAGVVM